MKLKLLFFAMLFSMISWGQATLPFVYDNGKPTAVNGLTYTSLGADYTSSPKIKFLTSGDDLILNFNGTPGDLSFVIKWNGSTTNTETQFPGNFELQQSADGTNYTTVRLYNNTNGTALIDSNNKTEVITTLNITTRYLKWIYTSKTNGNIALGSISLLQPNTSPTIITSSNSLVGLNYENGNGPSTTQTFTASGINLTTDIQIQAPTNYEISTAPNSGFTNSLILPQIAGVVATTSLYSRLKSGLLIGNYTNENIVITSAGATAVNVGCSGNVSVSSRSDIVTSGGEVPTISSLQNDNNINTISDGTQAWQFTVRDGGVSGDSDNLPTIINSIVISQNVGNGINDWDDAIQAIALFNGTTKIATGIVSANQITFSGTNLISIPDNSSLTLSLRLSVQVNPNNSGNNLDGDDFVFNLSQSNLITSPLGSGFSAFVAINSSNKTNVLDVIATKLVFTQQPSTTSINSPMTFVKITALDANNNIDLGFTKLVTITSSGIMTSAISATAIGGVATFNKITHSTLGNGLVLTATAINIPSATSNPFDIIISSEIKPGDVAIIAVNTAAGNSGSEDEISFVCFVAILPGTQFYLTDNGYERIYPEKWGNTEGIISLTRTNTILPKGSVITIHSANNGINDVTDFTIKVAGIVDANWTKEVISTPSSFFDLGKEDQVWIMQGGNWSNVATKNQDAVYSGNVLYGWTDLPWKTAANYGNTLGSTIYPQRECFTIDVPNTTTTTVQAKFNDPANPNFSTTTNDKVDWITLINNPANWNTYTSNTNYNSGGYDYAGATISPTMTIAANTHQNGKWNAKKDTNWFNCGNWETLLVPDETVDVLIADNSFDRQAKIENNATNSNYYGAIAKVKNLTISGEKVEIVGNINNKLEVYGNLVIDGSGILDMDDNTTSTDIQLDLYGNWINNRNKSAFEEGNGTVHFVGNSPQIINNNNHSNTEEFYNLILENNFDTAVSNNLIATNELTISAGKTITVGSTDYIQANKNLTNSGTLDILHEGSLIMLDDAGIVANTGTINITKTTSPFKKYDYTYWSSPIQNATLATTFINWNTNYAFYFDPTKFEDLFTITNGIATTAIPDGFDDNQDDWQRVTTTMSPGKGYIVMGSTSGTFPKTGSVTFTGTVNNGIINQKIFTTPRIPTNDDWNLVGNPYPSAISANDFINQNIANISGTLYFWTHKTDIGAGLNLGPDGLNFSQDDYATYNLTGGTATSSTIGNISNSGSTTIPLGQIASGQGFFIEADADNVDLVFNNNMRSTSYSNSQFFKIKTHKSKEATKNRIWLNLENSLGLFSQQLLGYFDNATVGFDKGYDGLLNNGGNYINFYSFIDNDLYKIQGRSAFEDKDQVQLGYFSAIAGKFTIRIDTKEGVFNQSETNIYLEDKLLNSIQDLKVNDYNFETAKGTFNNRFVLRYSNKTLNTNNLESAEDQVLISTKNKIIKIDSKLETIDKVFVYDLLGKLIIQNEKVNSSQLTISNLTSNQQTLLVKVKLKNGKTVSKKVLILD